MPLTWCCYGGQCSRMPGRYDVGHEATKSQGTAQKYDRIFVEQFAWASDTTSRRDMSILGDEFRRYGFLVNSTPLQCHRLGPTVVDRSSAPLGLGVQGGAVGPLHEVVSLKYKNATSKDLLILHYKGFARESQHTSGTAFYLVPPGDRCPMLRIGGEGHEGCAVDMDAMLQHTLSLSCHVLWILDCPFSDNLDILESGATILCAKTPRSAPASALHSSEHSPDSRRRAELAAANDRWQGRMQGLDLPPEEHAVECMTVALADILAKRLDLDDTEDINIERLHDDLCDLKRAGRLATKPILLEVPLISGRRRGQPFMSFHSLPTTFNPQSGVLGPYRARQARDARESREDAVGHPQPPPGSRIWGNPSNGHMWFDDGIDIF